MQSNVTPCSCARASAALACIVLDDEDAAQLPREPVTQPFERLDDLLALDRLQVVTDRAERARFLGMIGDRRDVDRDVPRVRVLLQLIEDAEARMVGQVHVEQDRARPITSCRLEAFAGRVRDDALEAHLVRELLEDRGEAQVVLDHEDDPRVRRQLLAIVVDERRQSGGFVLRKRDLRGRSLDRHGRFR